MLKPCYLLLFTFRRIPERFNQYNAEIETLNKTWQELSEGSAKISENISKLEREEVLIKIIEIQNELLLTKYIFCFKE